MNKIEEEKETVVELLTSFLDVLKYGGRKTDHELIEALAFRSFDFCEDRDRRLAFAIVTDIEHYIHNR